MCVFYCRFCIRSGHTPLTPWGKGLWTHLKRTCSSTTSTLDESVLTAWSRDNNNFYCARPLKYCSFGILLATLSLSQILQVIFTQKQSFKQSAGTWEAPPVTAGGVWGAGWPWGCIRAGIFPYLFLFSQQCIQAPAETQDPPILEIQHFTLGSSQHWPPLEPAAKHFRQGRSHLMSTESSQRWRTWRHKLFL